MNELKIIDNTGRNKFDEALNSLNELQVTIKRTHRFNVLEERGGLFGWFEKKVSAEQMNDFSEKVQNYFNDENKKINACYKQLVKVYEVFETLDREYIAGIVGAFNQAIEATNKVQTAQQDIKKTIDDLVKMRDKFGEFITKANAEFSRIDPDNWKENAMTYQKEIKTLGDKAEAIFTQIYTYQERHEELLKELNEYKKERERNTKALKACCIVTGVLGLITVTLILLIVFGII